MSNKKTENKNDGLPFNRTTPQDIPTRDSMTDEKFNRMLEKGYEQAQKGEGLTLEEAFNELEQDL